MFFVIFIIKTKSMKSLLISGDTMIEWNLNEALESKVNNSNKDIIEKLDLLDKENRTDFYFRHRLELLEKMH